MKTPQKRFAVACMAILLFSMALFSAEIKGIIKDHRNHPLASVTITLKNSDIATLSDIEGKFIVPIPGDMDTKNIILIFDREGFYPEETSVSLMDKVQVFKIRFTPDDYIREKITVTALDREEKSLAVPMAETSVSLTEMQEKVPENVVEALSDTPGVHFVGKGGFSVTPSIRGLARQRVLVMVDGERVTNDRRVGSSASFVPPEMTQRIEVVRSSSSVLYGSDAIGGVVNILTRPRDNGQQNPQLNALNLNLNSVNKRVNTGITYGVNAGKWYIYSGFQYSTAGDYSTPDKKINHSGYNYYSGLLDVSYMNEKRDFYFGYVGGYGEDIGKPDRANDPTKYSFVPSESDHFIRFGFNEKSLVKQGTLNFSLYVNPSTYYVENVNTKKNTIDNSDTTGVNLGLKTSLKKSLSPVFSYQLGLEWFSRQNVDMVNRSKAGDRIEKTFPVNNGQRNDYGAFFSLNWNALPTVDINAGARYTYFSIAGDVDGIKKEKNTDSASYFLGVVKRFGSSVSLFCNVGRAFRIPTLSEAYYTGITSRKYVIANPNLKPESSFDIDTGVKFITRNCFVGLYFFSTHVNNLIELYKGPNDIYTYENVMKGKIQGGELEVQYTPVKNLNLFGHYFYYKGKSNANDAPLNDVPAPRIFLGGKIYFGRLWFEGDYLYSFKKTDPGPAEVANAAYSLVNLKGGYYLSSSLFIYLKIANLLNETYFANPDPDIPEAKGIDFSAGIHFYF
ncbi:MAG TPA: TonB-dependent receptor [Candidatus Deferrimicrobium sp.]|nr:TonB-dependent receptor [Candidatus Deferrimicrobium sp.]